MHGYLIPDLLEALGIEANKENVLAVKEAFKKRLEVGSTAALSDTDYSRFAEAVCMIASRDLGVEIPREFAEKTMKDILIEARDGFDRQNASKDY